MAIIESTHRDRAIWSYRATRPPFQAIAGFRAIWAEWQNRRRYREDLNRLLCVGPYMIKDIGLPLEEAARECKKPLWRA